MTKREARVYRKWRAAHLGKWRYPSRRHAWFGVARMWVRHRRADWDLHPYACRWGPDWRKGASFPGHWHIGHRRGARPGPEQAWYWWHRAVVWPFYRARRRYRRWRKYLTPMAVTKRKETP